MVKFKLIVKRIMIWLQTATHSYNLLEHLLFLTDLVHKIIIIIIYYALKHVNKWNITYYNVGFCLADDIPD